MSTDPKDPLVVALQSFGWECGPEFKKRYLTDPWVFNLANAVERLFVENVELRADGTSGAEEVIYAIRRADGQDMGDYRFCTTTEGDWSAAEDDADESLAPVEYQLLKMVVEVVERKVLPLCSICDRPATHWGLCEAHAREDDPSYFETRPPPS